jgi:predicted small secreted protein
MKKQYSALTLLIILCFASVLLSGCDNTFAGTLMLLRFQDIVTYMGFCLFFGALAAFLNVGNWRTGLWIGFLLSLILTPVAGLIYCLILLTRRS